MTLIQTLFIVAFIISLFIVIKRAKKYKQRTGTYGPFKMYLSSICLYMVAVVNFIVLSFELLGIGSWMLTITLLVLGAYFTKYLSDEDKKRYVS
ncbi:hypothetical protein MUO14_14275 [Halobacillus shinanisalinarum]|uniref:YtpI-like protein n=1 Tax=Halobacillus shinanisalinarum TaxID=2932258 RepID=A0ABY4GUP4_9BACI|nr:hypothetical protein [Halobacillus shinanisalinarum]UOQ91709.1 hypothetical protein MUO14_14275 [Halobacillus shinanisalinarum]